MVRENRNLNNNGNENNNINNGNPTYSRRTLLKKKANIVLYAMHFHHFYDWVFVVFITATSSWLAEHAPFYRLFSIDDPAIQYPFVKDQRVSAQQCAALSIGIPLVVILVTVFLTHAKGERFWLNHISLLGLFTSLALANFITQVFKNFLGQPRPDLLSRCQPGPDVPHHVLVSVDICTTTHKARLADGFRSMPSGHSSSAFSGLSYLTFWLFGQLMVSQPGVAMFKALLALLPIVGSALIAISRTMDYRHSLLDVTVGSLIGLSMAYFAYRKFFPSVFALDSFLPYPKPPRKPLLFRRSFLTSREPDLEEQRDEEEVAGLVASEDAASAAELYHD